MMRVSSEAGIALGFTAGAVAALTTYNLSAPHLDDRKDWELAAVGLGTGIPGLVALAGVAGLLSAETMKLPRAGLAIGGAAVAGALLGVATSTAMEYEDRSGKTMAG